MSTFQARDIPFLQGMTFHTQSKTRNNIKRDIGHHILNGYKLQQKAKRNLESHQSYHFLKKALEKVQ